MEEDDQNAPPSTPFWIQSRRNNTYFNRTASLRNRVSTVVTQLFLTAIAAILIVFFILPPFFSSVSQIFRPHLVRKSWDYLNFVLVLFAVICGFLSRNSGGDDSNRSNREEKKVTSSYEFNYDRFSKLPSLDRGRVSSGATPRYWVDDQFSDQTVFKRFGRLRSSSSHPDLRLREFEDEEQWRFYDDTHLSGYRYDGSDRIYQSSSHWEESKPAQDSDPIGEGSKSQVTGNGHISESVSQKAEIVATATTTETAEVEEVKESSPLPPSPPLSPLHAPPSAKPEKRKTKRVYQDLPSKEEKDQRADLAVATPIPPPAVVYRKSTKQEKKKGGATMDFLITLRRKKKKQRQQSIDGLDLLFGSDHISQPSKSPPHPPPPPPPPPPFFQGLFSSKKGKSKRTNSTPPPPPPLPPQLHLQSRASISNIRKPPVESRTSKPNPPAKVTAFNRRDEIINTGNESPLMAIPKPPPPPPFKMPAWKFVKRGDYVRMASDISISSDEPDDSDGAQTADGKATATTTGVNLFCPSPDVDTKANNFIARFRAGLKLEKMNSDKRGRSNLGPESEPDQFGS